MELLLDWLSSHHIDKDSGLWGYYDLTEPRRLSRAVQAAYHFWLLYYYDKKPIPFEPRAVDYILKTQNKAGGFGQGVHNSAEPNKSSACEDIDSIDPLVRFTVVNKYRREDIKAALGRALNHVLNNRNANGSFVFMRDRAFTYGHPLLAAEKNAGAMFPTWFRTLSLAYLAKALTDSPPANFDWQFCRCPGCQFW